MRLTDEELSRVLTAHARGGLRKYGRAGLPAYPACLIQAAKLAQDSTEISLELGLLGEATWFDETYQPSWTARQFLAALEAQELA